LINLIDKGIKNEKRFLNSSSGKYWRRIASQTSGLRVALLIIYICLPFLETPPWCIDNDKITDPWTCQDDDARWYNSGLPKLPRIISIPIDILVVVSMMALKLMQRLYKHHTEKSMKMERL